MLKVEWLDTYTPGGQVMLRMELESLELVDGRIADVFHSGEKYTVEVYGGWQGELCETLRWVGPSAEKECMEWINARVKM